MTNDYTVEQARQDPIDLVTSTTELLDSDNWESSSGTPWPGFCRSSEGEEGASYSYNLLTAQRSGDLLADAQKVADHWEKLGMDVRVVHKDVVSPRVYATGGPVVRASFLTKIPGDDMYEVGAVGKCVAGYDLDLQEEERQRRADREVIPGDNYFHNHPPEDTDQE
ncbi:MAG TPA: hypothetical protein K8V32_01760 [Enteractinococcus helveticum]|uniref:Uncharacterized protein n=1 Tax=Enteractinococcus helveticum TaxID=1837282 RepID=A0A921FK25_9MICC|nr:hypothetical protein [Enteractinococcus helveticum]HJF13513.1 hypothetical protein [Enteractinococcus helveticum]